MQRDFANFELTDFDVGFDEHTGLVGTLVQDGPKNLGMLIVGGIDSGASGKIEPSNHPNFLRDLPVGPGDCGIASRLNDRAMKGLIELAHLMSLGEPFCFWRQPDFT